MLELFDELALIQRGSPELVVWSVLVTQLVTIGYPLTMFGQRVEPKGFRDWLIRRGLHLTCLCAAAAPAGETRSCRIVNAHDENVYAFCAYNPTRCNFFIDITAIYHSATLESYYRNLPTTKSGIVTSMATLRQRFMDRVQESPSVLNERCPYFEGYCGEHISQYPGITQSNGLSGIAVGASGTISDAAETNAGRKQIITRHPRSNNSYGVQYNPTEKGKSPAKRSTESSKRLTEESDPFAILISEYLAAATAGPSNSSGTSKTMATPGPLSNTDRNLLETLMRGDGISRWERDGIFESCDRCGLVFVMSAIRAHIRECDG